MKSFTAAGWPDNTNGGKEMAKLNWKTGLWQNSDWPVLASASRKVGLAYEIVQFVVYLCLYCPSDFFV
jgi:hypothetical protein